MIVTNHGGSTTYVCAFNYKQGGFGGVAPGGDFNGTPKAASLVELTEIKKVSPSDFFQAEGVTYLRSGSKTYRVAGVPSASPLTVYVHPLGDMAGSVAPPSHPCQPKTRARIQAVSVPAF